MCNKEIVKYFYEVIVSQHKLEELPAYLAEDCVQVSGSKERLSALKECGSI